MRKGMSVLHQTDKNRRRQRLTTDAEGRLPRGRALLVIAALSVLSWAVLIALFMALRAIV
jgi:hypothetical protein